MIQNRYAVDFDGVMEENRLYVARDLSTDERVLIKIFSHNKHISADFIQNFIDVSTVINDIGSKYILKIKDVGEHYEDYKGYYFIAYEYIEGVELSELIKGNYLHPEAMINISIEILKALESVNLIHKGVYSDGMHNINYHGSLKMQDIIVDKDYNIKIADFGITAANRGKNIRAKGNYQYMSPHQLCIDYTDYESDLFAFGIILYEMIFKKRPFGIAFGEHDMLKRIDRGPDYSNLTVIKEYEDLVKIDKRLLSRKNKYKNFNEVIMAMTGIMYRTAEIKINPPEEELNAIDKKLMQTQKLEIEKIEKETKNKKSSIFKKAIVIAFVSMFVLGLVVHYI